MQQRRVPGPDMSEPENRYAFPEAPDPPSPVSESSSSLLPAIVAGLVAALVGGIVWGLIVKLSDYEVGFVAWGIGFLAGTAVVVASRGAKGQRLQVIAVVAALLGILLGKYLSFAFNVQEDADAAGANIGLLSSDMFTLFRENLDIVFGLFDLLWVGFAVFSAWRIPQVDAEPATAPTE
jgi:steroid 5-alpha reductase family enzyme